MADAALDRGAGAARPARLSSPLLIAAIPARGEATATQGGTYCACHCGRRSRQSRQGQQNTRPLPPRLADALPQLRGPRRASLGISLRPKSRRRHQAIVRYSQCCQMGQAQQISLYPPPQRAIEPTFPTRNVL